VKVPFYDGEAHNVPARMVDYQRAAFAASTDFKVGEAIRYLEQKNIQVEVEIRECPDRRSAKDRQDQMIAKHRSEGTPLLNC
jgi:ribosomal 50S subunit-recycling heat shock protein